MFVATASRCQVRCGNVDKIKPKVGTMTLTKRMTGLFLLRPRDPEVKAAIDRPKQHIAMDPAFAHSMLYERDIVIARGKLTERCGG